jgi:hypothetical protein
VRCRRCGRFREAKGAPFDDAKAKKDADARMLSTHPSEALLAAPTRTFDDALCRIEHAIELADEGTDADLINSLNKALRVLRKVKVDA